MMKFRLLSLFILAVLMSSCATTTAKFGYQTDSKTVPSEVQFSNDSKKASDYVWDFGDGNTSTEVAPKHTYTNSGRYKVKLIAKDGSKTSTVTDEIIFNAPKECLVRMNTNMGTMTIRLSDATPKHRDNFVKLAKSGYYDDVLFHRVISNFMVQGGDPDSKDAKKGQALGVGGPSYNVDAEFVDSLFHIRGALAAARQGDAVNPEKKSSGSQFYIVHGNEVTEALLDRIEGSKGLLYSDESKKAYLENGGTPFLDGDYTVFGFLVEGFDVLDKIAAAGTDQRDRPLEDIKILSTEVVR